MGQCPFEDWTEAAVVERSCQAIEDGKDWDKHIGLCDCLGCRAKRAILLARFLGVTVADLLKMTDKLVLEAITRRKDTSPTL